ncbi:hypothetical protein [Microbacterium testaceum]|uniref:Uncharacterized protein n=1 Tax=Microbacterium testaceum TaxID=2033 RepID=A0A147F5S1_MICTE|nr:hypothetical protein [Microbacterium testaceum]KTS09908.1 hypothetical protein RSA3_12265 [Microbacterium testaceum]
MTVEAKIRRGPYTGYTVKVDTRESTTSVHYDTATNGALARFSYRLFRIPSERLLVVRYFHDATSDDRQHAERRMHVQGALFYQNRAEAQCRRRPNGTYVFRIIGGRIVDDPLVQLELETIIDCSQAASGRPA